MKWPGREWRPRTGKWVLPPHRRCSLGARAGWCLLPFALFTGLPFLTRENPVTPRVPQCSLFSRGRFLSHCANQGSVACNWEHGAELSQRWEGPALL